MKIIEPNNRMEYGNKLNWRDKSQSHNISYSTKTISYKTFNKTKYIPKKTSNTRCGCIIFNKDILEENCEPKILVIMNRWLEEQGIHKWGLPKGHIYPNENFAECAEREVREETGLNVKISTKHPSLKIKNTIYYAMYLNNDIQTFKPIDTYEVSKAEWKTIKELKTLSKNADLKEVLKNIWRAEMHAKLCNEHVTWHN